MPITLLDAVRSNPDDTAARLAYAKHLEDMGDPNHELVRLVAHVTADGYKDSPAYQRLVSRFGGFGKLITWLTAKKRRLLACDRAERVIHDYQDIYIDGPRRAKVETSRRYARGEATEWEMLAAWSAAAWRRTRDGSWEAACCRSWEAAWTAYSAAENDWTASFAAREDAYRWFAEQPGWEAAELTAARAAELTAELTPARAAARAAEGRWGVCLAVDYMLSLRQ